MKERINSWRQSFVLTNKLHTNQQKAERETVHRWRDEAEQTVKKQYKTIIFLFLSRYKDTHARTHVSKEGKEKELPKTA
jgi:hypothetical protein